MLYIWQGFQTSCLTRVQRSHSGGLPCQICLSLKKLAEEKKIIRGSDFTSMEAGHLCFVKQQKNV